jgi:hypothetical protein
MRDTLEEEADVVSLGQFIIRNFDALSDLFRSGKSVKQIYEDLKAIGEDVGTYHGFRTVCYRAGLRRRESKRSAIQKKSQENTKGSKELEKAQRPTKSGNSGDASIAKGSKYNPALPPVILPGGVEAVIDLETGAKHFEI